MGKKEQVPRETWPPMRLALARRASVPQPLGRASGRPGAFVGKEEKHASEFKI